MKDKSGEIKTLQAQ